MEEKKRVTEIDIYTSGSTSNKIVGTIVLLIFTISICYIAKSHNGNLLTDESSGVVAGFYLIPILLCAGFYGYLVSFVVFLLAFVIAVIYNMPNAYTMVIYLAAILSFSLCSQYLWFKKLLKTIFACTITFVCITFNNYLCFKAVGDMNYSSSGFFEGRFFTYKEIIAIYGCGLFLFLYYNYGTEWMKKCYPLGVEYLESFETDFDTQRKIRKTRVSMKITANIIMVEIILGICVAIFMMVLFPDIKRIFTHRINDNTSDHNESHFKSDIENFTFEVDDAMISFDLKMVMLMLCVGVPLAGIANFLTKVYIAGPLGDMADFMEHYANTSDENKILYGHKVDDIYINSDDEVKVMYDALHSTVYEIEAYIRRKEEKQKLENDLEIAKKASEAKSSFLSNMSHEIRTPINAMLGMNEMILRESKEEKTIEYANNAKSAGNSLLSLVNDILDYSKIEAGKMTIIPAQYHIGSTINDLVNMIAVRAEDKGLELEINVNPSIPVLLIGDELRIKQCVTNLLTNAVKYTEQGKVTLNVSFETVDDINIGLIFEVCDTGIGIKEEEIARLYSPFERLDEIRNRSIEGTGLGMNIVKKLLALMDTRLQVESVYGQGSKFSFKVKQQVVSWEELGDFKQKYKEFVRSAEQYHARFTAPSAKILVVDDTEMNLTVIKNLLKQTKVQVETAESGFETIKLIKENKYDVIFLDHRMPEMDGIETFETMKQMGANKNHGVPVIALTANAVSGAKEEYVAHGFADYLAKPVDGLELEKMLEHYIPPEKIESVSIMHGQDDFIPSFFTDVEEDSILHQLKDIDLDVAVKNCGGAETLEKVVSDFYVSINPKANLIESMLKEEDIRNYTVLVHALKSSARLIGAMELSDMAANLERYGNEDNIDKIKEQNPALLEKYRSYKESFKALVEKKADDLPELSVEDFEGALKDIKELVEAYDFDTADSIIKQLEEYKIPNDCGQKYDKLVELMAAVDREEILRTF